MTLILNSTAKTAITPIRLTYGSLTFSDFFFFWWDWGLTLDFGFAEQALYCLSHTSSPFCSDYFGDGAS
jgi:hypothetical protein